MKDYNNKIANAISPLLSGFEKYIDFDGTIFLKNNFNKSYFGFSWFMSENYKGEIVFRNTAYWVNYPELENIVRPIFSKNSLQGKCDIQGTISSFIVEKKSSKAIPYDENLGMVVQPETLNDIIDRLRLIIESESLPYYEYWNSLQSLYDFIKDKEGREELDPILGQFWQFKKAAILRLCNDSRYQEYMDAFVARRKTILDDRPGRINVQRYYNAAAELKEVLDKTEPIYNVKHKNTISRKMK